MNPNNNNVPAEIQYFLSNWEPSIAEDILAALPVEAQISLYAIFEKKFITRELHRCFYYYACHPEKKPKNIRHWSIALMRWLDNAYLKKSQAKNTPQQSLPNF